MMLLSKIKTAPFSVFSLNGSGLGSQTKFKPLGRDAGTQMKQVVTKPYWLKNYQVILTLTRDIRYQANEYHKS